LLEFDIVIRMAIFFGSIDIRYNNYQMKAGIMITNTKKYLLVIFLFGTLLNAQENHKSLPIGAAAPDFNLPGIDGNNYALSSFSKAIFLSSYLLRTIARLPRLMKTEL